MNEQREDRGRLGKCRWCRGRGQVPGGGRVTSVGSGVGSSFGPCPACGGSGIAQTGRPMKAAIPVRRPAGLPRNGAGSLPRWPAA
jgi:hypothetical protein